MKTAVIYARYSSENQTEQSIEGQLRVCKDYAERNNILILDTYIDRAMTGTNDNRPDFQRMIKDSKKHEWNYVLVYKLDRFSRNKYESVMHKRTLKDNGVTVLSAMENIPDTPEGIILESLLEGMNQYYSAELSQKVKRGMNETRLKNNFAGGYLLYGYKVVDHKILIDEDKAATVRYIYQQYANGVYVKDIIKHLTANHIYNRGKPFARNTVYAILRNEKYIGIYRFQDQIFDQMYPQIVPYDLFEIVRQKINANKYGKRSTEVVYLLKNKIKCGYCGSSITAECGTTKNGIKRRYYKCIGRKHHNGCHKLMIKKDVLEDLVLNAIHQALQSKIDDVVSRLMQIQNRTSNNNTMITVLQKEKRQAETSLNNIMQAVENGLMNNTTNKRMQDLEQQIEDLEKRILLEQSKTQIKLSADEIKRYYLDALKLMPQQLINCLIKQIELYDDKIKITFNTPIKGSDNTQGPFYCQTIKMIYSLNNSPLLYPQFSVMLLI